MKWCLLILWLLFFAGGYTWPWSYPVIFPLHVLVGIATVCFWFLTCRADTRRQFLLWGLYLGIGLCAVLVWSIFHPTVFTRGKSAFLIGSGNVQFAYVLGECPQQHEQYLDQVLWYRRVALLGPTGLPWRLFWFDLARSLLPPRPAGVTYFSVGDSEIRVFAIGTRLWTLIVFCFSPALLSVIYRLKGKPRLPQACDTCGYDLTGIRSPRCPECGSTISAKKRDTIIEADLSKIE